MRHFLVIAASSRGGRLFTKMALRAGHDVTALCRAASHEAATERMHRLLESAELTPGGPEPLHPPGRLTARNSNILDPATYRALLDEDPTIDAIVCFVGPTRLKDMMSRRYSIYTDTIGAMLEGMEQSRTVEVLYHSSVGTEGVPRDANVGWPSAYPFLARLVPSFLPVFKNVTASERMLGRSGIEGLEFIVFRPSTLTDDAAVRRTGYALDHSSSNPPTLPTASATTSISREDVAEEILRVASLPRDTRSTYHGHAVYLTSLSSSLDDLAIPA